MTFTRRTHIVRISDAKKGDPPSDNYIDIEVLDAISFRGTNGEEMILNSPAEKAIAYIVDDTGGKHGQTPGNATRRSHMKRIKGKDGQQLDVEVMECMAFRDKNGEEWILDTAATNGEPSVFNTTEETGDNTATRRTHNEKIGTDRTAKKPTDYVTVERCDAMAFRTINGKEMVIKCPSSDDPNGSDPRASTHIWSPEGYDPDNEDGPKPPANTDQNVYAAFVEGASGFLTGDAKISQGPFWWIRKVSSGADLLAISYLYRTNLPFPSFKFDKFVLDSNTYDVLTLESALVDKNAKAPTIANPITAAMTGAFYMFACAPAYNYAFTSTDDDNLTATDSFRANTLFFNLSKIKAALPPNTTSVTISAVSPTTTGFLTGPPSSESFVDEQFAATPDIAKSITIGNLSTLPEFGGIIDVFVNQLNPHLSPSIAQMWVISGHYSEHPLLAKYLNWTATAYTYGKKRDKKAKVTLDTIANHDGASGFTPPIADPVSQSKTLVYNSTGAFTGGDHFSFTVDLKTLEITPVKTP